jgi:ubiquinol-cytochrome c reductase iron-sulfur subunit
MASIGRYIVLKVACTMSPDASVLAASSLEVEVSKIQPGSSITVKWRGKPVFIRKRTPEEIAAVSNSLMWKYTWLLFC